MGLSASKNWKPDAKAAQLFHEAEHAVFRKYGVKDFTTERHLELSSHPALGGCPFARVIEIRFPNDHSNTCGKQHQELLEGGGKTANEIPILFFHGGGGTPCDWMPILPHLVQQQPGRVLYLVERPGNGISFPMDYSKVEFGDFSAQFVAEIVQALNLRKFHLVGNSFGGGTVMFYAARHPTPSTAIASITLVGIPAGFSGMNVPWIITWVKPWMGTIGGFFAPYVPFLPAIFLGLALRLPVNALSVVYLYYVYRTLCFRHNTESITSLAPQLYAMAHHEGKGWKLQDLERLHKKTSVYVLMGSWEPFITNAQQDEITRYIGPEDHIRDIGFGHIPWFADPPLYADTLQKLWTKAEDRAAGNSGDSSSMRTFVPIVNQNKPNTAMVSKRGLWEPRKVY